jgi:FkbM family methyltransferase
MDQEMIKQIQMIKNKIEDMIKSCFYNEAFRTLDELEEVIPMDVDIYFLKSTIHSMKEDWRQAEEVAKKGLVLEPQHVRLLQLICDILCSQRKFGQMKIYLSHAINLTEDISIKKDFLAKLLELEKIQQYSPEHLDRDIDFGDNMLQAVFSHIRNEYKYNYDIAFRELMLSSLEDKVIVNVMSERQGIVKFYDEISSLYTYLSNETSRDLLLLVMSYRILGNKKVKLPLNAEWYWRQRNEIKSSIVESPSLKSPYHGWTLEKFDLNPFGYPIHIYYAAMGIQATYFSKQYEYSHDGVEIKAKADDVVIDCGGCWGDTALYFASQVNEDGKVYTFEFIPSNIELFKRNLELNPHLSSKVTLIPNPVWDKSGESFYIVDKGPASHISSTPVNNGDVVYTMSIDDLVQNQSLNRVDLIKMDIEGAETAALRGATQTLLKFKPKLAIAVYHDISDFGLIPKFISDLGLKYRFYLGHFSTMVAETVLFGECIE